VIKDKPYVNCSDAELMKHITNADKQAFNEIYKRYSKRLLYYFYRMLGDSEEMAQDFLQDLFYKLIDKPHLYNPDQRFSTWVFSIAHNMCKNEYRRRSVRNHVILSENVTGSQADGEDVPDLNALVGIIYDELNNLDESHKTAFILRYREGFRVKEISEILNLPEGTVKSRLFYTRQILADKLKKADVLIAC
jgi:RNA polymerase sigma-70 factor (ECF subfamily)